MTQLEFTEKCAAIDKEIYYLKMDREDLAIEFVASLPYKVGDKVRVISPAIMGPVICFVSRIKPSDSGVQIGFNGVEADGTMSENSAGIHVFDSVEIIDNWAEVVTI